MRLAKDKLIIALDVPTPSQALELVAKTRGLAGMYKIGSQLFTAAGPSFVRELIEQGEKVFLDLKFHDIPNTVAHAGIEAARLGVSMFNVHALGGVQMMRQVAESVGEFCSDENLTKPIILAVTILTSLNKDDLKVVSIGEGPDTLAPRLAQLACGCGLDGVVASVEEASHIRRRIQKPGFVIVTPGIRPSGAASQDQKRIATPQQALLSGADYLVVGRPIIESDDPRHATETILNEVEATFKNKYS
ncbi:MAG: orotidine-5'-phosphate decarboxylase [candidate division WOR-3 bacterium]